MENQLSSRNSPCCAVLMATTGRRDLLRSVSLPSVRKQSAAPVLLVLVTDGCVIESEFACEMAAAKGIEFVLLRNLREAGAAGAWNTGLEFLASRGFDGFVAMLDDDDEWDATHVAANLAAARRTNATVVVSGLRFLRNGVHRERVIPQAYTDRMFLVGNPGWQGSNTFAAMRALTAVGGFRDGLASANDRDLAIRLLRWPEVRVAYTGQWTATWHQSSTRPTLSTPRSQPKLRGLRWFWQIYGPQMTKLETEVFFDRAANTFGFAPEEIVAESSDQPPHCEPRGDLLC